MRPSALAILLLPVLADANGGPVAWTSPTGRGDLAPADEHRVTLVSERLEIRLDDDGTTYRVSAEYVLSNPGAPVHVKYGVPLLAAWPELSERFTDGNVPRPDLTAYARTVRLELAGRSLPCALEDMREVVGRSGRTLEGWCTAAMEIPQGESIALRLQYLGSLEHTDNVYTDSPFTAFGERRLHYRLAPAGGWAGRPALDVAIETGRWGDLFRATHPSGFRREGSRLALSIPEADLKALAALEGRLDAAQALGSPARAAAAAAPGTRVTTSGTLPARGAISYRGENLLDGDTATAWCSSGNRAWVELRVGPSPSCWYEYVLTPGYAKNQQTWTANNRLRRVRFGACGPAGERAEPFELASTTRFDASAVTIHPRYASFEEAQAERGCVRLTVVAVDPGPDGDTCLSELKPVLVCN